MARPKVPLLSRRNVVAATLGILEREGPDALSVRRIAEELNVNAASLYHHFSSKDDILAAASRAALAEMNVPDFDRSKEEWIDWFSSLSVEHRRFLIARPYMVPLIVQGVVPRSTLPALLTSDAELRRRGVTRPEDRAYILDTIEGFVIGSALMAVNMAEPKPASKRKVRDEFDPGEALFAEMVQIMTEALIERFASASRASA